MVKDDLIPLNDAASNLSTNKQRIVDTKMNPIDNTSIKRSQERESMQDRIKAKPPSEAAQQSP